MDTIFQMFSVVRTCTRSDHPVLLRSRRRRPLLLAVLAALASHFEKKNLFLLPSQSLFNPFSSSKVSPTESVVTAAATP